MYRRVIDALTGLALVSAIASGMTIAAPVQRYSDATGGWAGVDAPQEFISEAEQAELWQRIQYNIALLAAQGRLPQKSATAVKFGWPTRFALGRSEFLDHAVSNYVDQDPAVNSVRDYNCGHRSYDTASVGGGHKGTDISLGHRAFYKQDTEQIVVVAAAAGVIVAKDDTNPDRSCGDLTGLFANPTLRNNVITIRHDDASFGIYFHVKAGSLTTKAIGDTVSEGEYLGAVGSSGFSSGPHLHFEVRTAANVVVDPWAGSCNPTAGESWWRTQPPYLVKEVMSLMPSSTQPFAANLTTACVNNVAASESAADYLQPDFYAWPDVAHSFTAFLRDAEAGDAVVLALKRPDGSQYATTKFTMPGYQAFTYAFTLRTIPASEPAGQWTFDVTYAGHTRSIPFWFNVAAPTPARVYEFHHAGLDHYFRTAAQAEADSLTPASGFLRTGDDFFALDRGAAGAGAMGVCRFYGSPDPGPNSHFYTADPAECRALQDIAAATPETQPRWNYEETAFAAVLPQSGSCPPQAPFPVYRLYNRHQGETVNGIRQDSNHRFTTLSSVYYRMALQGWSPEGVVMCAGTKP